MTVVNGIERPGEQCSDHSLSARPLSSSLLDYLAIAWPLLTRRRATSNKLTNLHPLCHLPRIVQTLLPAGHVRVDSNRDRVRIIFAPAHAPSRSISHP